jgi:RHS repeat-associated protein
MVSYSFDLLNRLTSITSVNGQSATLDSHGYLYNNANQRTSMTNADNSYWIYQYDTLGQVTSGIKYWSDGTPVAGQQFGYLFDSIGNRQSTTAGGDQTGANLRSATYSANNLNQYSSRTVPNAVDIIGSATNTATVTVNGQLTYRKNAYYRLQLGIDNSAGALFQPVTNLALVSQGSYEVSSNFTGNVFLPKSPETFSHDLDGNLSSDGRWTYSWDAENRLVSLVANTAVGPQQSIKFEYDARGRRIGKKVWNNTAFNGTPALEQKFLYDGWNLSGVLNSSFALQTSFIWGSDLSGSMQGAGGVGGLLEVNDAVNGVHFVAHDGNGNVTALAKAADGTVSAQYEYGPFGELLRATGPMAKANPFRFSTKYEDDETDLLYYGYRYDSASTGSWLSRDPAEEDGGLNLHGFLGNCPIGRCDFVGLWSLADHKRLTSEALVLAVASIKPGASAQCLNNVQATILRENVGQDLYEYDDLRRHYNRAVVPNEDGGTKRKADQAYEDYVRAEYGIWFEMKEGPTAENCQKALEALGRISHSHEDFFAHAIRRDGQGGTEAGSPSYATGWIAWTAVPAVVGDPYHRGRFWPSSYSITGGGEHPPLSEPLVHGGPEYTARFRAARQFEFDVFKTILPIWFSNCKCSCK